MLQFDGSIKTNALLVPQVRSTKQADTYTKIDKVTTLTQTAENYVGNTMGNKGCWLYILVRRALYQLTQDMVVIIGLT
jgi:hypothetical protein